MHRPYRDEADLTLLLRWLSEYAPDTFMHPGDLVWWLRQNTLVDPAKALELFFEDGGELQGFVYCDSAWSVIQGRPDLSESVWDDMVACAAAKVEGAEGRLVIQPHEWDTPQVAALSRAGFTRTDHRMLRLVRLPGSLDAEVVALPAGFHFADMSSGEISPETRVKIHQDVWHPSRVTLEAYQRLQAAPLYRPDLDVMVVAAPDGAQSGKLAAYALGWYDPGSRTGLMEPVGTHADFRRQGLGQHLIREMTRRIAALGAQKVTIGTYEKNVAATALYRSAGYEPAGYWVDFQREQ